MGEIVNLRRQRKANARQEADTCAAENRVRFGRTLAAKQADKAIELKRARDLDGRRLESGEKGS
jgi:hypothetical protein